MKLHEYQKQVIDKIIDSKKLACWLDMGLGKTIITLTAIQRLIDRGEIKNALVIAPKTVCENVWAQEAEAWDLPLRVSVVTGTEKQRQAALVQAADVYVISRDNLAWLFLQSVNFNNIDFNMLVVDESTSLKDRSTQRWASLCQKSIKIRGKKVYRKTAIIDTFDRVLLLSGTPASESYAGLWAQIYLLDRGERLGKTIGEFRRNYMVAQQFGNGYPVYTHMQNGAIERINDKLKDICVSMKSEDYLQLPEAINVTRYINSCGARSCIEYERMEKHGVVTVDNTDIIAGDTLTKYGKLQQITSGFIYDETGNVHTINTNKIDALIELMEATDEHVLVLYKYDYEKKILMEKIKGIPLDEHGNIELWNAGKIKVGLLYPASGGYGLNLARGGSIVVWYTLPLSLEQYLQSNKRIHRQGQTKTVRIYHLLARGTIDEKIYLLLQQKQDVLNGLMRFFNIRRST